ncbi:hypothetical protein C8J56DRAFT_775503 [Mycena floridula]|nr:hypothetical protein C8J56DRAFT_775503 [Mycena floridula]
MLKFALLYLKVIDAITADKQWNLHHFELDAAEWRVVKDLVTVLEVFKKATLFFSRNDVCTITSVIPTMDRIDSLLAGQIISSNEIIIRIALLLAKSTLNRYYSLTDSSDVYRIAMVLHPNLKLKYFQTHQWPKAWIDTACEMTEAAYQRYVIRKMASTVIDTVSESQVCPISVFFRVLTNIWIT